MDLPAKVETVRRRTRPWKSIFALLLAIAAAIVSYQARTGTGFFRHTLVTEVIAGTPRQSRPWADTLIWIGTAVGFCVFASSATVDLAGKSRELIEPRAGVSHAAIFRYALLIVGLFTTLVLTLELIGVPIGQLVLGGALTSVFVGIAAQQALSNVFAGLVLLFARPFRVGDEIRLKAGALGGQIDGIVTDIGITYVRLDTDGSIMSVPNSQVLNAVVGPVPPKEEDTPPPLPVVTDGKAVNPGGPEKQGAHPPGPT
jgi:small-conductance mechanosensitive channel